MAGILATILGASGVLEKGMELIDSMHTSTEEEIAAKTKAKVDLMNSYAPFKVAQRYLAIMFTTVFLLSFLIVLVLTLLGVGEPDDVIDVVNKFWIGEAIMVILTFYFGGGFAEGIMSKRGGQSSTAIKVQ